MGEKVPRGNVDIINFLFPLRRGRISVMSAPDDPLKKADESLAAGDYVAALDTLDKMGLVSADALKRINIALDRMKKIAQSEMIAGRWSVAEGIVDEVQRHGHLLSPKAKAECESLIGKLGQCRESERRPIH